MAKLKTFHNDARNSRFHDEEINKFLQFLEDNAHVLIDVKTIPYGTSKEYIDTFRTEIYYRENHTRKVIVEKNE